MRMLQTIRTRGVRYLYLTDQAVVSWRYPLYRMMGVKSIVVHCRISVPDPDPVHLDRSAYGWLKFAMSRVPFLGADRVYAVSDFVRDRLILKGRFPEKRAVTIINGVDVGRIRPPATEERSGPIRIVCAGRATKHKGIHILIEAARVLRDEYGCTDFVVVYAGDGPDMRWFEGLVKQWRLEPHVLFSGQLSSIHELLERADIVVVPSIWGDACPSSVAEGMASGRPLVATAVGGVPEQVGDPGNAVLVPPGDVGALAAALVRLIGDPEERRRVGCNGRRRAELALDEKSYHQRVLSQLLADFGFEADPFPKAQGLDG